MRCLENVDAVNHLHFHARYPVADFRVCGEDRVKLLTLRLGQLLGVIEPAEPAIKARLRPTARKHDGGGDHWPGKRTSARLIYPRNERQALLPQLAFVGEPVPELGAQCIST